MSDENINRLRGGLISAGMAPPPPPPSNTLASLFARPIVTGLYYNRQKVVLDGYTFTGCRFDNCTLEVSTLNFDLIRCVIDPSTVITYGESLLKVIQLFNGRYPWAYEHFPAFFVPIRNDDGSITISGRPA